MKIESSLTPQSNTTIRHLSFFPPRVLFVGWLLWTFLAVGTLGRYFGVPREIIWIGLYGPILLLFFWWLLEVANAPRIPLSPFLLLAIILFGLYAIFSALIFLPPPSSVILALRDYFKYILLFFPMLWLYARADTTRRDLKLLLWILILQLPLVVMQFFGESKAAPSDSNSGTFGWFGTGELILVLSMAVCLLFSLARQGLFKWRAFALTGWFAPIIPLAGAFAGFIFMPLAALLGGVSLGLRNSAARLLTAVVIVLVGLTMFWLVDGYPYIIANTGSFGDLLNWNVRALDLEKVDTAGNPGRLRYYQNILQAIDSPVTAALGQGIGTDTVELDERLAVPGDENAARALNRTSVGSTFVELGWVGTFLYLGILGALWYEVYRYRHLFRDRFWLGLYGAFTGILVIHILGAAYQYTWGSTWSSLIIWLIAAMLIGHGTMETRRLRKQLQTMGGAE